MYNAPDDAWSYRIAVCTCSCGQCFLMEMGTHICTKSSHCGFMLCRAVNAQQIDTYQLKSLDGQFGEFGE